MSDDKTNALQLYQKIGDPMVACEKLGKWFAGSGLFGITKPEQGMVLALACMIRGENPLDIARRYDIIEGNLSKKAATILAEFQSRGGRVSWIERSAKRCAALFIHPEYQPKGVTIEVLLEDLVKSGVAKDRNGNLKANYARFPRRMLHARCVSEGVTAVDPEVTVGTVTPEEIWDERDEAIETTAEVVSEANESAPVRSPEPEQVPDDPPEHKASQEAAEATERAAKHVERVERVVDAFKVYTLELEDLERFLGDEEDGVVVLAKDWTDDHFSELQEAHDKIKAAKKQDRAQVISNLFQLPTSALEG